MSLDISVTNMQTGDYLELNWLRNPFGLCQWAEDTYLYQCQLETVLEEQSLYYAINHWNYDKSPLVDKALFLETVQRYGKVIFAVKQGFFWFPQEQFPVNLAFHIMPSRHALHLMNIWEETLIYQNKVALPMEHLTPFVDLAHKSLADYQDWYRELITFAEMLQDPDAEFYCSN